jgi:hypothetical protein
MDGMGTDPLSSLGVKNSIQIHADAPTIAVLNNGPSWRQGIKLGGFFQGSTASPNFRKR